MGWRLHRALKLVVATLVVLSTDGALGYPVPVDFDGSLMRWNIGVMDNAITYEIKADAAQDASVWSGAIDDAAAMWSAVPGSYFTYAPAVGDEVAQVTVHLQKALAGVRQSAGYTIFDRYNGRIPVHCSIFVQVDDAVGYTAMAKTFLHELGHGLGLGHSLIPQAIMSYSLDRNALALDIDDEAAAARLYPADGSKPRLPPGCAVGALADEGASWWSAILLLVAPLAWAVAAGRPDDRRGAEGQKRRRGELADR